MIFQHTHKQVLSGEKTQTRRIVKPGEVTIGNSVYCREGLSLGIGGAKRLKWKVGRTYAVQPGRTMMSMYWDRKGEAQHARDIMSFAINTPATDLDYSAAEVRKWLKDHDYREARIKITAIRQERVRDISEGDAEAEGVEAWTRLTDKGFYPSYIGGFRPLWNEVHGAGAWERNDLVWVLEFEVAR